MGLRQKMNDKAVFYMEVRVANRMISVPRDNDLRGLIYAWSPILG